MMNYRVRDVSIQIRQLSFPQAVENAEIHGKLPEFVRNFYRTQFLVGKVKVSMEKLNVVSPKDLGDFSKNPREGTYVEIFSENALAAVMVTPVKDDIVGQKEAAPRNNRKKSISKLSPGATHPPPHLRHAQSDPVKPSISLPSDDGAHWGHRALHSRHPQEEEVKMEPAFPVPTPLRVSVPKKATKLNINVVSPPKSDDELEYLKWPPTATTHTEEWPPRPVDTTERKQHKPTPPVSGLPKVTQRDQPLRHNQILSNASVKSTTTVKSQLSIAKDGNSDEEVEEVSMNINKTEFSAAPAKVEAGVKGAPNGGVKEKHADKSVHFTLAGPALQTFTSPIYAKEDSQLRTERSRKEVLEFEAILAAERIRTRESQMFSKDEERQREAVRKVEAERKAAAAEQHRRRLAKAKLTVPPARVEGDAERLVAAERQARKIEQTRSYLSKADLPVRGQTSFETAQLAKAHKELLLEKERCSRRVNLHEAFYPVWKPVLPSSLGSTGRPGTSGRGGGGGYGGGLSRASYYSNTGFGIGSDPTSAGTGPLDDEIRRHTLFIKPTPGFTTQTQADYKLYPKEAYMIPQTRYGGVEFTPPAFAKHHHQKKPQPKSTPRTGVPSKYYRYQGLPGKPSAIQSAKIPKEATTPTHCAYSDLMYTTEYMRAYCHDT